MTGASIAVEVLRLAKVLGRRAVLQDVDFQIGAGQRVALVGANGAGKTTLLRCLASLTRPSAGEVPGSASPPAAIPRAAVSWAWWPTIACSIRTSHCSENLVFAARMCDVGQPRQRSRALLESTGLRPHGHRLPATVSRGMRQRLSIARALVHRPRILLLDEPFAGLDAEGAEWLMELLAGLGHAGQTVCFTAHDEAVIARLADRVLEVRSGRVYEVPQIRQACRPRAARSSPRRLIRSIE